MFSRWFTNTSRKLKEPLLSNSDESNVLLIASEEHADFVDLTKSKQTVKSITKLPTVDPSHKLPAKSHVEHQQASTKASIKLLKDSYEYVIFQKLLLQNQKQKKRQETIDDENNHQTIHKQIYGNIWLRDEHSMYQLSRQGAVIEVVPHKDTAMITALAPADFFCFNVRNYASWKCNHKELTLEFIPLENVNKTEVVFKSRADEEIFEKMQSTIKIEFLHRDFMHFFSNDLWDKIQKLKCKS